MFFQTLSLSLLGCWFWRGSAATTEAHRFIYDGSNGDLFYDSDGTGENERVKLARLNSGLDLSRDNLFII